jgi:hypothetical protein
MRARSFIESITWLPAKLAAGDDCPSFGALLVTGHTFEEGQLVLAVRKPDTDVWQNVVFAREGGIKAEGYGEVAAGMTIALCNSAATPANGENWGIKSGEFTLRRYREGFRVVGPAIGSAGAQRAIVRPYEVKTLWGVFTGTLSPGGSAGFDVYFRDGGSWTSSGTNITVHDRLLITGQSVASGKWGVAFDYGDHWWAQEAQCPTA